MMKSQKLTGQTSPNRKLELLLWCQTAAAKRLHFNMQAGSWFEMCFWKLPRKHRMSACCNRKKVRLWSKMSDLPADGSCSVQPRRNNKVFQGLEIRSTPGTKATKLGCPKTRQATNMPRHQAAVQDAKPCGRTLEVSRAIIHKSDIVHGKLGIQMRQPSLWILSDAPENIWLVLWDFLCVRCEEFPLAISSKSTQACQRHAPDSAEMSIQIRSLQHPHNTSGSSSALCQHSQLASERLCNQIAKHLIQLRQSVFDPGTLEIRAHTSGQLLLGCIMTEPWQQGRQREGFVKVKGDQSDGRSGVVRSLQKFDAWERIRGL